MEGLSFDDPPATVLQSRGIGALNDRIGSETSLAEEDGLATAAGRFCLGLVVLADLTKGVASAIRALKVRFDKSPIDTVESLTTFAQTRASFIGQTSLYGYLKERMGTQYREIFQDESFARVMRGAAVKVFLSCLSDLVIFCVATTKAGQEMQADEAAMLAQHCYKEAMARALSDVDADQIPNDALVAFEARTRAVDWDAATEESRAFAGSEADLVRFAPVIEEFKELDRPIVHNSIRFRWRDVRDQFRHRVEPTALCSDWRRLGEG